MVNSGEPSVVFCHCAVSGDLGPLRVSLESFAPHAARKYDRPQPGGGQLNEGPRLETVRAVSRASVLAP